MKKKPLDFDPENIVNIDKDPLMRESDRGCVLVCASDVDNLLSNILERWTRGAGGLSKSHWKRLSDYTGPLGTFSSRLEMAKAIGLLDATLYADINAIRIIRNRAAHGNSDFSLSATENAATIASMNWNHEKKSKIARYSPKITATNKSTLNKEETTNESILKGFGFIRYDKHNFILTVLDITLELNRVIYLAEVIGRRIPSMRHEALQALSEAAASKDFKL